MKKILLVEDNGVMVDNIRETLNPQQYQVIDAHSYAAALDRWAEENGNFDCVIIDLLIYPDGLDQDNNGKYDSLFGMAFINKICEDEAKRTSKMELYKKFIVYSGFSNNLIIKSGNGDKQLWDIDGLKIINKDIDSIDFLAKEVIKICEK